MSDTEKRTLDAMRTLLNHKPAPVSTGGAVSPTDTPLDLEATLKGLKPCPRCGNWPHAGDCELVRITNGNDGIPVAHSEKFVRTESVGTTQPTENQMTTPRRIDPLLTQHINLYVEQVVQRVLQIAKRPHSYDASEHAMVSKMLDDVLESYSDDAAELDAIKGRKRIKRIPSTNEIRAAMGREPIEELEDEDTNPEWRLNVELLEKLRLSESAVTRLRTQLSEVSRLTRDSERLDEVEKLIREKRLGWNSFEFYTFPTYATAHFTASPTLP